MDVTVLSWRDLALCTGMPSEWFISEDSTDMAKGQEICQECPVQDDCFMYGFESKQPLGVWGGELPKTRGRWETAAVRQRVKEIRRTPDPQPAPAEIVLLSC